jgi:hypothetical protein
MESANSTCRHPMFISLMQIQGFRDREARLQAPHFSVEAQRRMFKVQGTRALVAQPDFLSCKLLIFILICDCESDSRQRNWFNILNLFIATAQVSVVCLIYCYCTSLYIVSYLMLLHESLYFESKETTCGREQRLLTNLQLVSSETTSWMAWTGWCTRGLRTGMWS